MKKSILALAVILNCSFVIAQTEFDASKIVQGDINGTARYMSMAGAFGALGGEASAIKDNPAGLGIYRTSEMTGTLNISLQNSNSNWKYLNSGNLKDSYGKDNLNKNEFSNFSYIKASPTIRSQSNNNGLLSSNWSFSYNRLKSFNRNSTIKSSLSASSITDYYGYFTNKISNSDLTYTQTPSVYEPFNNDTIPWMSVLAHDGGLIKQNADHTWSSALNNGEKVTPTYTIQETGFVDEYSLGWAGNFSNIFYLGTTLNLQSLNYNARSKYSEVFSDGGGMTLDNNVSTSGAGLNLNVGAIIKPINMLRFGISVHTPTVYALSDNNYSTLNYNFSSTNNGKLTTPTGYSDYKLSSPWKFNASAAIILGQKGLISGEYDYNLNTNMKFYDKNGNATSFDSENAGIKVMLKDVQTIKIGGEFKLTGNFSLRAGYATISAGTNNSQANKLMIPNTTRTDTEYFQNNRTDYLTGGFGFHKASWFLDFAYMNKILDETFYPYNSNNLTLAVIPASVKTTNNNFIVTLGFKL